MTGKLWAMKNKRKDIYQAFTVIAALLLLPVLPSEADDWSFGGHVRYQLSGTQYAQDNLMASLGDTLHVDQQADLRLKAERKWDTWDASIHYALLAAYGDTINTLNGFGGSLPPYLGVGVPSDKMRLFNLAQVITDSGSFAAVHRLDRASFGYTGQQLVMRFGRQAISWGNGVIFHPMDIFNPFSPTAINKEYKTGDDMVYGQWLYESGNDMQGVLVPRRTISGDLSDTASSIAMKYRGKQNDLDFDLLAARHYDENLIGIGLARDWKGAVWRTDITTVQLDSGGHSISAIANISYSWTWSGHNVSGNLEYYRNGTGISDGNYDLTLPQYSDLVARLSRGEIYNIGRDYVAGNIMVELSPRWIFTPTVIWNINDGSVLTQAFLNYDWKQNAAVLAGITIPYGPRGTEFGGVPAPPPPPNTYIGPGNSAYVQISYYF